MATENTLFDTKSIGGLPYGLTRANKRHYRVVYGTTSFTTTASTVTADSGNLTTVVAAIVSPDALIADSEDLYCGRTVTSSTVTIGRNTTTTSVTSALTVSYQLIGY